MRTPIVVATLALATVASAGPTLTQKCISTKLKASGKDAQQQMTCASKGAKLGGDPDPLCVTKAGDTLEKSFVKADIKTGCPNVNDHQAVDDVVEAAQEAMVDVLEPGATDLSHKCAAGRRTAAGKLASGLLVCEAKAALLGVPVDPVCQSKATLKFESSFAKAASKGGCVTTADAPAIETQVSNLVATLVGMVTTPTTTTTSTSTTIATTSTTMFPGPVHFAADIQPILTASCSGCHNGISPAAGLKLVTGQSYAQLVNVPSIQCGAFDRVEPGDPTASYLIFKLDGSGPCYSGSQMPIGGSITQTEHAMITAWITLGALND